MAERITGLEALLAETKATHEATRNQYIDLRSVEYRHDPETGMHMLRDTTNNEDFIMQSKTALKQLCRMIRVPHAFVTKNPNFLNDGIMSFWLEHALSGGDEGTKKAKLSSHKIIRYFESGGVKHIRAIVDEDVVPVDNFDIINTVLSAFGDGNVDLDYGSGAGVDDESFHARFVLPEVFDPGDGLDCQLGFHIRSSELAQGSLVLDALIFRKVCSNGAIITYGNSSYFDAKFKDIMLEDLRSILGNSSERMKEDLATIMQKLRMSIGFSVDQGQVRELFASLKHRRGLSFAFMESVEGHALDPNISNFWQVTNTITKAAQDLNDEQRMKYERLAGNLLNLDLPKLA